MRNYPPGAPKKGFFEPLFKKNDKILKNGLTQLVVGSIKIEKLVDSRAFLV